MIDDKDKKILGQDDIPEMFSQISVPISDSKDLPPTLPSDPVLPTEGTPNTDNLLGQLLGNYRIIKELGRGTFGRVYLAQDTHTDRLVAIKVKEGDSSELSEGFLHEAKSIARLDHPNIVRLLHYDETRHGVGYIVYEFVEGETLASHIKSQPLAIADVVEWIASIADALDYAYRRGIVHRDISPRNIMINQDGKAKLLDFGLSRLDGGFHTPDSGRVIGTPHFMSPEQASGKPHWATSYSDLFSLGSVLYYALTGQPPFQGTSILDITERIQLSTPASPRSLRQDIPVELEKACLQALAKEPQQRFSTGGDFANAVRQSIESKPLPTHKSARPSNIWPMVMGAALLLVGIGCILGAWMQFSQPRSADGQSKSNQGGVVSPSQSPKMEFASPQIAGCQVFVQQDYDSQQEPIEKVLPLAKTPARLSVSAVFENKQELQTYLLIYNEKQQWHSIPFVGDRETINGKEHAGWLSRGVNMILLCVTKREIDSKLLDSFRAPFVQGYKVTASDKTKAFEFSLNATPIFMMSKAPPGVIRLNDQSMQFNELTVDSRFENQLKELEIEAYYGLIFGILPEVKQ